jgi:DNA-binding MarR family transcriptional regulator
VPHGQGEAGFDPLGRQLNVAARATFSSWTVLAALKARGPVIQKDLAKSLDMIGPSMVERIDQLEQSGLVVRSSVPEDRRASLVTLTDDGRALFARLDDVMRATEAALTSGLDPRDVAATRRVLARVAEQARALRAQRPA